MQFEYKKNDSGEITFIFTGHLDSNLCSSMEPDILALTENASKVVFDLAKVTYITSYFLRICGRVCHKVKLPNFSVVNTIDSVKKVFKIAGITEICK